MRYPGRKIMTDFGYIHKSGKWSTEKGQEAWEEYKNELRAWWRYVASLRYTTLPEYKGIPVPDTGKRNRRKHKNGPGVSAHSRVLSRRFADEGKKGKHVRRSVRQRERELWVADWLAEQNGDTEDHNMEIPEEDTNPDEDLPDYVHISSDDLYGYCEYCGGPCEL